MTDRTRIQLIGFDADDTLWDNASLFVEAEKSYSRLLAPYMDADELHRCLLATETRNMPWYGYGVMAYTLSLIENAVQVSGHRLKAEETEAILEIGRGLLAHPVRLTEGASEVLPLLQRRYRLVLITKGDLLDQERKLEASGLKPCFDHIEIVSEKGEENYLRILRRLQVEPEHFLMVGNSLKSDVSPVLNIGAQAIHCDFGEPWEFERGSRPEADFMAITHLKQLIDILL